MRFILLRLFLASILISILVALIAFARGYRINPQTGKIGSTGILLARSAPDGARIFVNGTFMGATNQNISLSPGFYDVEINKEGYTTWKSNLGVKGEVVTRADATLFPLNPSLSPLSNLGIIKAQTFTDVNRVLIVADNPLFASESANITDPSTEKNGIFIFDNSPRQITLFNPLTLLVGKSAFPKDTDLSRTQMDMAPDGKEFLLTTLNKQGAAVNTYLIPTDVQATSLFDVSKSKQAILSAWELKKSELHTKILETFKKPFAQVAETSFEILSFSPDETKLMYKALANATIPIIIKPRLIGTNQNAETRDIKTGKLYVYDKKEDRNYELTILDSQNPARQDTKIIDTKYSILDTIMWHPNSTHLIVKGGVDVSIFDFDGSHGTTVYSGPFEQKFLSVTGDGKLLILANLNPQRNSFPDLYAVGIK